MSNTPNFDKITDQFRALIADVSTYSSGSLLNGNVIDASGSVAYVNRAMFQFIETAWEATKGDMWKFVDVFPELIATGSVTFSLGAYGGLNNGTSYVIASPYLDYAKLLDIATHSSRICRFFFALSQIPFTSTRSIDIIITLSLIFPDES